MSGIGSLVVSLEANIARFSDDMGKAAHVAEQAMKRIEFAGSLAKAALGGIGAALSIGGLVEMVQGTIEATAKLKTMADQTGATVETLSAFRSVAKQTGTDMDGVVGALQKLSKHMYDAAGGSVSAAKTFDTLGMSVLDASGKLKRPDDMMFSISQRLAEMGEGAGKTAILMELFGTKTGANLAKFIVELGEKQSLQTKITTEQAAQAEHFERAMARLSEKVNQFKTMLVLDLLPALEKSIPLIKTAAEVTAAYFVVFVGVPALVGAAAAAVSGFMALVAASGTMTFGASIVASFGAIVVGATLAQTAIMATTLVSGVLFAAWAGWEIGSKMREQFLSVQLFGIALVAGLVSAWEYLKFSWVAAVNAMQNTWGGFVEFIGRGMAKLPGMGDLGQQLQAYGEAAKGATMAAITGNWQDAAAKNKAIFDQMADDAIKAREKVAPAKKGDRPQVPIHQAGDVAESAYAKYLQELDRAVKKLEESEYASMKLKAVQLAKKDGITDLAGAYDRINNIQRQESQRSVNDMVRKLGEESAAYAFQTGLLGLTALEQDKLTFAMQKHLELEQLIAAAKRSSKPLDAQAVIDLGLQTEATITLGLAQRDQRDAKNRSGDTGITKALNDYRDDASNAAKYAEHMVTGSLSRMEDALVSFAKTGKLSFSSLFGFMAEEYLRKFIKMQDADMMKPGGGASMLSGIGSMWGAAVRFFTGVPLATGTNSVPYDGFQATLHKGEAVVPAAYNPAAGGQASAQGNVFDFSGQTINVGQGVSRGEVAAALKANQNATVERIRRLNATGRAA